MIMTTMNIIISIIMKIIITVIIIVIVMIIIIIILLMAIIMIIVIVKFGETTWGKEKKMEKENSNCVMFFSNFCDMTKKYLKNLKCHF